MLDKVGPQRNSNGQLIGCRYMFNGINNQYDPSTIKIEDGKVIDAVNVYFDNANAVIRRLGYSRLYSGDYKYAWNNDTKSCAYMVKDFSIYLFDGVNAPYPVATITNNILPMEFLQINDIVVYSNTVDFGILGGVNNQKKTYSPDFKINTFAGRCLEYYHGRLYLSVNNTLYCTDTFDIEHMDIRKNHVATFPHTITMCKRVVDGLWIGTEKYVYFLQGDDIIETSSPYNDMKGGFTQHQIIKASVLYGTACKVNSEFLPEAQCTDHLVVFLTSEGICSGGNTGKFMNHSFNEVSFDTGVNGTATIVYIDGTAQYIVSFDMDAGYYFNPYINELTLNVTEM